MTAKLTELSSPARCFDRQTFAPRAPLQNLRRIPKTTPKRHESKGGRLFHFLLCK
jgi:hypothetical protein